MATCLYGAEARGAFADAPPDVGAGRGPLWSLLDRFLAPLADRLGADELRRARLAVAICASIAPLALVSTTNLLLHGVWGNVPIAFGLFVTMVIVPFALRSTGSLMLAGNAIAGVLALALAVLKVNTGAVAIPPFVLLPGVPLLATVVAGPRSGLFWGAVALLELGAFYALTVSGFEPVIELNDAHLALGRFVGSAMMVVFVLLLARAYEGLKTRALDELRQARQLAEDRSREIEATRREQLELKDRLLSHVSHELRTPLAALHQFLSIVLDGVAGKITEEQQEYLAAAFRNAEQLRHMIDDLMDLNRARNGKLRVECDLVSVAPLLTDTVRGLGARAAEKRVRLEECLPGDLPLVQGDSARIRQVLGNLVENAIKFTPEGGSVTVTAAPDPEDDALLRVSVCDTGCGIEPEAVKRIFERLHQEDSTLSDSRLGLGLGLAIVKELVKRQGGRIWVESQLGHGSTFHFVLPTFSIARAVESCAFENDRLRTAFSVIRIEIGGATPQELIDLRRGVLHLLRSSIFYPERDVVLPAGASGGAPNRFTVLAATGVEGGRSLTERLRTRLDGFAQECDRKNLAFRVHVHTEEVPAELGRLPKSEALERLGKQVGEILRQNGNQEGEET